MLIIGCFRMEIKSKKARRTSSMRRAFPYSSVNIDAVSEVRVKTGGSLLDEFEGILAGVHRELCDGDAELL